jgi:hypothetical protein
MAGVHKIGCCESKYLPADVVYASLSGLPVYTLTDITLVPFYGTPECVFKTETKNNGIVETAELKFKSNFRLERGKMYAFFVKDTNEDVFLIGCREAPYPVISANEAIGADQESASIEYTVKWESLRALIWCNVDI